MPDTETIPTVAELRTEASAKAKELRAMRATPADKRDDAWKVQATELTRTVNMLDAEITMTERAEVRTPAFAPEGTGPRGATAPAGNEPRSFGDVVSERLAEARTSNGAASAYEIRVPGNRREVRTLLDYTNTGATASSNFVPVGSPFLSTSAIDRLRLFVEDLIPSTDTNLATVPYIRESLPRTNETGAQTVAEGAVKPEVSMFFERADAPVRKIAAWVPVTDEIVEDAPTLRGYIDGRLTYMIGLRAEAEILNGDGTGVHLLGILNQPNVQTQALVTLTGGTVHDISTTVGKAIEKIELVDGYADGCAMNPTDFWNMVTLRPTGDGHYDGGSPYGDNGIPSTPWGLVTVRTRSMAVGTALVGGFRVGAQIFNRDGVNVKVGMINDDFIKNRQVILAERRLALAVHRPDFFVRTNV